MLVLCYAAIGAAGAAGNADVFKTAQGKVNFCLVEVHDRLAIRALVAGVDQRVERERVGRALRQGLGKWRNRLAYSLNNAT
jgi:hypothetical protein